MAAGRWSRPAAERRIARTQLFVFVASWLWNHVASLVNATPVCRSHPRLVPMNTQSEILCDPASLVLYGRCHASSRPSARSRKGESRRTLSERLANRFLHSNRNLYNPAHARNTVEHNCARVAVAHLGRLNRRTEIGRASWRER